MFHMLICIQSTYILNLVTHVTSFLTILRVWANLLGLGYRYMKFDGCIGNNQMTGALNFYTSICDEYCRYESQNGNALCESVIFIYVMLWRMYSLTVFPNSGE